MIVEESSNRQTDTWEMGNRITEQEVDEELRLFDFSHYPVPTKDKNIIRVFYNNINGLEINLAIEAVANNTRQHKKLMIF